MGKEPKATVKGCREFRSQVRQAAFTVLLSALSHSHRLLHSLGGYLATGEVRVHPRLRMRRANEKLSLVAFHVSFHSWSWVARFKLSLAGGKSASWTRAGRRTRKSE